MCQTMFLKFFGGGDSRGTWRHVANSEASKDCEDRFADAQGAHPSRHPALLAHAPLSARRDG